MNDKKITVPVTLREHDWSPMTITVKVVETEQPSVRAFTVKRIEPPNREPRTYTVVRPD